MQMMSTSESVQGSPCRSRRASRTRRAGLRGPAGRSPPRPRRSSQSPAEPTGPVRDEVRAGRPRRDDESVGAIGRDLEEVAVREAFHRAGRRTPREEVLRPLDPDLAATVAGEVGANQVVALARGSPSMMSRKVMCRTGSPSWRNASHPRYDECDQREDQPDADEDHPGVPDLLLPPEHREAARPERIQ